MASAFACLAASSRGSRHRVPDWASFTPDAASTAACCAAERIPGHHLARLCRCCSGLRLLELGLALGLHRSCGSEGLPLRPRPSVLPHRTPDRFGACLRCGEVGFRLLIGGAGCCGLRIRRVTYSAGCDKDGISGIALRTGSQPAWTGHRQASRWRCRVRPVPFPRQPGRRDALFGGTDCLRGGAYGICLGLIEGIRLAS